MSGSNDMAGSKDVICENDESSDDGSSDLQAMRGQLNRSINSVYSSKCKINS